MKPAVTPTGAFAAWVTVLMMLCTVGVLAVLTIGYVRRVDQQSDRRNIERQRQICGIIVLIDDRNQDLPPTTDVAATEFRRELHAYRVGIGCP